MKSYTTAIAQKRCREVGIPAKTFSKIWCRKERGMLRVGYTNQNQVNSSSETTNKDKNVVN